jgi:Zn-dependent M32 family carboxypeptidase
MRAGCIVRTRADADELAYALHIIVLRFGPERALTAVELTVADIPMLGTKARTRHHGLSTRIPPLQVKRGED